MIPPEDDPVDMPMHHDHDHELVMDLAAGTLDIGDPAMGAQVGDCAECLEEVRLQRAALAALRQAPEVRLHDLESARLRRQIAATLGHEQPAPVEAVATRRRIAWAPLASVAAVLLAIVLVAPTLDLVGGDDDDAGDMDSALEQELEADGDAGGGLEGADTAEDRAVGDDTLAVASDDEPATAAMESETTMAAADATATFDAGAPITEEALPSLDEILSLVSVEGDERAVVELSRDDTYAYAAPSAPDVCAVEGGIAVGGLVESSTFGIVDLGEGGPRVLVTVHRDPRGETTLVAHDPTTCGVLLITP